MLYKPLDLPYKHCAYEGVPMPANITAQRMEEIKKRHRSRHDDIFIATYPKCGTTWLQHLVNEILGNPQGDSALHIDTAVPWLEGATQDSVDNMLSPRAFKSHDKLKWVPKGDRIKYIYCYRNPKDVVVSYYHHAKLFSGCYAYERNFNDFVSDVFLKYSCTEYGFYFEHVAEWLEQKANPNILFLTYEDMVEDLRREIKKIVGFFRVCLDEKKLDEICASGMFSSMQKNPNVNYCWREGSSIEGKSTFIRKGEVGDWMNFLTEEQSREIESLVDKYLVPLGAKIRYTLP